MFLDKGYVNIGMDMRSLDSEKEKENLGLRP